MATGAEEDAGEAGAKQGTSFLPESKAILSKEDLGASQNHSRDMGSEDKAPDQDLSVANRTRWESSRVANRARWGSNRTEHLIKKEEGEEGAEAEAGDCDGLKSISPSLPSIKTEEGQLSGNSSFAADGSPSSSRAMDVGQVPLWIKWRGKWQAGLQCSLEDCPAATVKAMPTYGKKMYIVVFFPSNRSFAWTDWQLVCSISETPEPLASGCHESGRNSVADLNAARHYMLKRISTAMLDISDRLPVQAVVECARDVGFWKEFAKEAAKASKYNELGAMLVTLKNMIVSDFLNASWMQSRFNEWKHQCETAEKAGLMEKLVKELRNAVLWDEVGKLWDQLEQMNLDSEWKTWKESGHSDSSKSQASMLRTKCSPVSVTGRRRTYDAMDREWDGTAGSFDAGDLDSEPASKRLKSDEQGKLMDLCDASSAGQIRIKHTNTLSVANPNGSLSTEKLPAKHGEARFNSTIVRCSAFSVKKGRQCNKYASGGSTFCFKHEPGSRTDPPKKAKVLVSDTVTDNSNALICSGTTIYGRRCTHKAKDGSQFCLKHMLQDAADANKRTAVETSASRASLSGVDSRSRLHSSMSSRKRKRDRMNAGPSTSKDSRLLKASLQARSLARIASRNVAWKRCIGLCRGSGGQCSHRAKPGYSHCEKHLPSPRPDKSSAGTSKTLNGEVEKVVMRLKRLVDEYLKARLLNEAALDGQCQTSWQKLKDHILAEAAKDLVASESLYDALTADMESLKKVFEENNDPEAMKALVPFVPGPIVCSEATGSSVTAAETFKCSMVSADPARPLNAGVDVAGPSNLVADATGSSLVVADATGSSLVVADATVSPVTFGMKSMEQPTSNLELLKQVISTANAQIPRFKCKLCAQEFVELVVLGQHWRACHKKESQQYFRGYICHHCSLPFTNKKGLYRHRNAHHPGTASQSKTPLIALCISCSGQFPTFEDLWQHIVHSHPAQLCAIWPIVDQGAGTGATPDLFYPVSGVDESNKCSHCERRFVSPSELQRHVAVSHSTHLSSAMTLTLETTKKPVENTSEYRYKCKICGLPFRLLPDLGRHHQAQHKPAQAMRIKNAKEDVSGQVQELGIQKERKKLQKLDVRRAPSGQIKEETWYGDQHVTLALRDPAIAEIESYRGPKVAGFPTNKDILAAARISCCKNKLNTILQNKYSSLPDRLALKAAKLCSEANVRIQFHREGYICPNGCKELPSSLDIKPSLEVSSLSGSFGGVQVQNPTNPCKENYSNKDILIDDNHVVLTSFSRIDDKQSNKTVLCEDLSFGKETIPIPCVIDKDTMGPCSCSTCTDNQSNDSDMLTPWVNFCYVTKRMLDPSLGLDTESSQLGCSCQGACCSAEKCEHVYLFDNDNTDARDIYGKPMTGRFPYDSHGCIILEEGYLVYECNSSCRCHEDCQNRVLQKGVQVKLEVYKTQHKGWAVRAAQKIARGTFVCEYIGEVLDDCEANRRGERYDKEGCSYLYDIDAHIDTGRRRRTKPFVIDATRFGNVARFINHSCSPNLVNYQVLVESMDCQLAHIGLYATRDIEVGEELAYDYRYKLLPGKGCPCHCGAKDCRGRLY